MPDTENVPPPGHQWTCTYMPTIPGTVCNCGKGTQHRDGSREPLKRQIVEHYEAIAGSESTLHERDEEIARAFHDAYERLAPDFNYRTRDVSAVPWSMVPQNNRRLMRATVLHLLNEGIIR